MVPRCSPPFLLLLTRRLVHRENMEPNTTAPRSLSQDLISLASPPRPPPFKYVRLAQDADEYDEKAVPLTREQQKKRPSALPVQPSRGNPYPSPSPAEASAQWTPYSYSPDTARQYPASAPSSSTFFRQPQSMSSHARSRSSYPPHSHSRDNSRLLATLRPWLPLIMYAITSLAFVVAFALYRTELFTCMDFPSSTQIFRHSHPNSTFSPTFRPR